MPYDLTNDTGQQRLMMFDSTSIISTFTRLNSAGNRVAYTWQAEKTATLSKIILYISNVNGTVTNIAKYRIFNSDASTIPSSAQLASGIFTPISTANFIVSGLTLAVTANNYYSFVLENIGITPTSNWFDIPENNLPPDYNHSILISPTSGQTWTTVFNAYPFWNFIYNDNSRFGPHIMSQRLGTPTDTVNCRIYNTSGSRRQFYGVALNTPHRMAVYSVEFIIRAQGTVASAGVLVGNIHSASALLGVSTNSVTALTTSINEYKTFYFNPPVKINTGEVYFSVTQSITGTAGSNTNYYYLQGANFTGAEPGSANSFAFPQNGYHSVYSTQASVLPSWSIPNSGCVPWCRINYKILSNRGSF